MRPTHSIILVLSIAALLATGLLPSSPELGMSGSSGIAAGVKPTLETTYSKLPMSFEKNTGQTRSGVDFIARGSGYSVFLSASQAVLALKPHKLPDRIFDPVVK